MLDLSGAANTSTLLLSHSAGPRAQHNSNATALLHSSYQNLLSLSRIKEWNAVFSNICSTIPDTGGVFGNGSFPEHVQALYEVIQATVPPYPGIHATIVSAEADREFAQMIKHELTAKGFNMQVAADLTPSAGENFCMVQVPVLSGAFLTDGACLESIRAGHEAGLPILPILKSMSSFDHVLNNRESYAAAHPDLLVSLPFMSSVLNRANRVPGQGAFDTTHHLPTLISALHALLLQDTSPVAALAKRVPKLSSLIGKVIPPSSNFVGGQSNVNENIRLLVRQILPETVELDEAREGHASWQRRVIFISDGASETAELTDYLGVELKKLGIEAVQVAHSELRWWAECDRATHVVVLLSGGFAASGTCESQITYAKDTGHPIAFVMQDYASFQHVMTTLTPPQARIAAADNETHPPKSLSKTLSAYERDVLARAAELRITKADLATIVALREEREKVAALSGSHTKHVCD